MKSVPLKKLSTSELNSSLLEIRSSLKVLLKEVSDAVRTCKEQLQSEAVPSQPEISQGTPLPESTGASDAAETAQADRACDLEPHALSFGVSGGLAQRLCKAAAELDTAAATVWEEALDYERVDLAEVCCPPDSVLTSTMLEVGGSARRYSWWNGFDLVTRAGAEKLQETLRKARPRVIWASPPNDETSKPEDQRNPEKATNLAAQRRRNRRIQQNLCWLLCAMYAEGWCEVVLEQPASCGSWRSTLADLKTQFPWVRVDGCAVGLRDASTRQLVSKPWHIVCTHERLRTVLAGRRCPGGHEHAPCFGKLATEPGGYTKAMAHLSCKAVLAQKKTEAFVAGSAARRPREEADAEPAAKRLRSEAVDDTPAQTARKAEGISADPLEDPADQAAEEACEPAGPRNCPPELRALSAREFAKAEAVVAKLHENMGHCSMRTVTSALQRRKAHPVLLEMSKWWKCQACEEALRLPFLPVASGRVEVPHRALGLDQFYWTHPVGHVHVRATLMIDQGSRVALVHVHEDKPTKARLGNTSAEEVRNTLTGTWFKYYGKPEAARTDPDGCFNALSLRSWLASKGVAWEPEPAGAHHRLGVTERYVGVFKEMASKVARRLPDDTSPQEIFDMCTTAHNDLHRTKGASPWQLLLGRVPHGLGVTSPEDQTPSELAARALEPEDALRRQLELKTAAYQEYIARELSEQSARAALSRTRTTRNWNSGDRVWYWREITRHHEAGASHKAPVSARGIGAKQGRFLGPATVLLQERGVEQGRTRRRKVVWLADGQQILRVATHHLRHLTTAEQALQDVTDSEAKSFQDLVQGLRRGGGM